MLIENRNPKIPVEKSNFLTLVGDKKLARLFQRVHSAMIGQGSELEQTIYERYSGAKEELIKVENLNFDADLKLIYQFKIPKGHEGRSTGISIDFALIQPEKVRLFEVKAGSNFDTKKSKAEIDSLCAASAAIRRLCGVEVTHHMVLWNCVDASSAGVKDKRIKECLLLGHDFCKVLGIKYEGVNKALRKDQEQNVKYLLAQMKAL